MRGRRFDVRQVTHTRPRTRAPAVLRNFLKGWCANRIRTCDPVITNDVLYQLSYCGGPNAALGREPETPAPDIGDGPDWQEKRGANKAFSSEVGTGSRQENASKQNLDA